MTACRAGELVKLTWADVDLEAGRLLFRETKNAESRTAWVQGKALELLQEHAKVRKLKGGLVFENAAGGAYQYHPPFKQAVSDAGIVDFRFHDLRHTAATHLAQQGATEQQLRAIGGWKSNVVSQYVHLAAEDAKAALEKLAQRVDECTTNRKMISLLISSSSTVAIWPTTTNAPASRTCAQR